MSTSNLQLKVDLAGQHAEWFLEIKKRHGFQTNTEMVRHMIYTVWEVEALDNYHLIDLPTDQIDVIKRYLERKEIKEKFMIYSVKDFVNSAIKSKIEEIRKYAKSILHIDVRARLNEDEREVAVAFQKCHRSSADGSVSVEDVMEELGSRNRARIAEVMESFVHKYLLSSTYEGGQKKYYVENL